MLTLFTGGRSRDCEGITRRNFIQAGTLGLGGISLPTLLAARAQASQAGNPVKDMSVVVLCLSGGATHVETFDPKMTAPAEYRSMTGEVATTIPGVTIGGGFPELAKQAHRMAIVRSYKHGTSSHGRGRSYVLTGGNRMSASMGSLFVRVAGTSNPHSGLPNYSIVTPQAVDAKKYRAKNSLGNYVQAGELGSAFNPFDPSAGGAVKQNMLMNIARERLDDRRGLLVELDRLRKYAEASDTLQGSDEFQQQAFDVILGGAAQAFDLSKEDPAVRRRYTTEKLKDASARPLGEQMLMARRLVEAGCGFVTVSSGGWDMHRGLEAAIKDRGAAVDHAVATFIDDLHERGLDRQVLLVITGDFGRTPRINKRAGRDHWGNLCTLAFAGGGLKMGQVVGTSDAKVSVPATDQIGNAELTGTILHSLIDVPTLRLSTSVPSEVTQFIASGRMIHQLV